MGKDKWVDAILDLWSDYACVTYVRPMYAMSHAVLWASLIFLTERRKRKLLNGTR